MFNMMIMRKDLMESYCDWLFPVLFELEKSLTESGMADNLSDFDARLYGRVSERLFQRMARQNDGDRRNQRR